MAISGSRWMSGLADQTPMTAVSIPGTHDACCHDLTGVAAQILESRWAPLLASAVAMPAAGLLGLTATEYLIRVLAQTQTLNIRQQLDAGVRFFDLRPSFGEGQTLPIYHGIVRTTSTLPAVLHEITKFLQDYRSEYVVLRLKTENDTLTSGARKNILQQCLTRYGNFVAAKPSAATVPVSEVRGKMVLLLDGIDALSTPFGSHDWRTASIQDDYQINANENFISTIAEGGCNLITSPVRSILGWFGKETSDWCEGVGKSVPKIFVPDKVFETKRLAIRNHHQRAIARVNSGLSRFSINFVSCVGAGSDILFLSPQVCSGKFNPGLKDLVAGNGNGEKAGIVVMDFVTQDLARGIYQSNKLAA